MASKYDVVRQQRSQQGSAAKERVLSGVYKQHSASSTSKYDVVRNRSSDLVGIEPDIRALGPIAFDPFKQHAANKAFLQQASQPVQPVSPQLPMPTSLPSVEEQLRTATSAFKQYEKPPTRKEWMDDQRKNRQELAGNNPIAKIATGLLEPISTAIDAAQAYIPGLSSFQRGAGNVLNIKADTAPVTGPKVINKAAEIAGTIAGSLTNPSNISQGLVSAPYRAGQALSRSKLPNLVTRGNVYGNRAIEGATAGAIQGGVLSGVRGETDLDQLGLNIVLGAAVGGAGDVALTGLGAGLSKLFKRNGVPDAEVQKVLALPAPQPSRIRGNANTATTDEIMTGYVGPINALPEPNVGAPTTARISRPTNQYREQFENLMANAQRMQQEGRFTPGREDADLESLWTQMAPNDGVSLDELITRAYPKQKSIAPDLVDRARSYQGAREVAGAPLPVKTKDDRYVSGPISPAAAPQTLTGRAPGFPVSTSGPLRRNEVIVQNPDGTSTVVITNSNSRVSRSSQVSGPMRETKGIVEAISPQPMVQPTAEPTIIPKLTPEEVQSIRNDPDIPFSMTDDVDDIIIPEDDTIASTVRSRLSTFADDLIISSKAELAKGVNRLSSNPVDIYAQYAKLTAGYMLKGTVKLADITEQLVKDFGEEIRPHVRKIFQQAKPIYQSMNKQIQSEELGLSGFEAQELKDISSLNLNTADVYRNFKKVFGEHYPSVKAAVIDPFDRAKGSYAQEQKTLTDALYKDIVQGLGIRKGSADSALVQQYGENQIDLAALQAKTENWEKIVEADQWFRRQYDSILDRVNTSIASIYPNNTDKLVPKRSDYYRHFQELKGWEGLVNLFDTTSGKINATLSGTSPYVQPKTKWASFKQSRGLGEFKNDAVGGFLDYIPAVSYAIHIDPQISTFRNLAKRLAEDTDQTKNINNFLAFVNNYANDIAGKTSPLDRWAEAVSPFKSGRNLLHLMTMVNNRVKSNVILGNVRSTLSQLANIPNGIAFGGADAPIGALRTIESVYSPNEAMQNSNFLKERYIDKSFRKFNDNWWEQPKRFAEAMMEISDRVGTSFIWNTAYVKAQKQGIENPIRFADEQTRRLVSGRGVGEQPLLIKSKTFNLLAPFQLEVNNLWRVMKDFVDEKQFGSLALLFVSNFLLNKAFVAATGSGVVLDPIDAIADAVTEDVSLLKRGGRILGEGMSNMPMGQTIAAAYPEYGANWFGVDWPTREEFFGKKDPTRFGGGLLAAKGTQDPIFKLLLPFGGNQIKKTIQGVDSLVRGGSYTDDVLTTGARIEDPSIKFPVDASNPADILRASLFSPYATEKGQEYTKNERRPLSEKQTKKFQQSADGKAYYDTLMSIRDEEKAKRKQKEIAKK